MTAETLPSQSYPTHAAAPAVIALHVHDAACACPACTEAGTAALGLARLGAFLKDESDDLDRVLRLLDLRGGREDLAALRSLHVEPGGERVALTEAAYRLERLLDDLAETPTTPHIVGLPAAADRDLAKGIDGAIRWLGARTQDVLSAVRHALAD